MKTNTQYAWQLEHKVSGNLVYKRYSTRKEALETITHDPKFTNYRPVKVMIDTKVKSKSYKVTKAVQKKATKPVHTAKVDTQPILTRDEELAMFLTDLFGEIFKTERKTVGKPLHNSRMIGHR